MKFFFIFSFLFLIVKACPPGWTDGQDSNCYKLYERFATREAAFENCYSRGGYLATPKNAFANSLLLRMSGSSNDLWVGIRCFGSNSSVTQGCYYDDGTRFTNQSYINFYPQIKNSSCVYMNTNGYYAGGWGYISCNYETKGHVCQIPKVIQDCPPGYFQIAQNGTCYSVITRNYFYNTAQQYCIARGGNLAVPTNEEENNFVASLINRYSMHDEYNGTARLGVLFDGTSYIDVNTNHTIFYDHFSYPDSSEGYCVELSANQDALWNNAQCTPPTWSVCQTAPGAYPSKNIVTTTTHPPGRVCTKPSYHYNQGYIESPYYPNQYNDDICTYIINVSNDSKVELSFSELQLENNGIIKLYDSETDTVPFATITSDDQMGNIYISKNHTIKVVASFPLVGENYWFLLYLPITYLEPKPNVFGSGCNAGIMTAPGIITSPNYPNNYSYGANCYYRLTAKKFKKVLILFDGINLAPKASVMIFDGPSDNYPLLGSIDTSFESRIGYKSSGSYMTVVFTSTGTLTSAGFSAKFIESN